MRRPLENLQTYQGKKPVMCDTEGAFNPYLIFEEP
jgi:hypothetical protein